ncbi:MAG: hypothetical protein IJI87_00550 [Mogibacterium sp.]|nr:hypothetical protein [Mogibacterium sp.]
MNTLSSLLKWIGNQLTTVNEPFSITRTSGAEMNMANTKFLRCGKIVSVQIGISPYSTEVAAGGNIFVGKLNTSKLFPATAGRVSTYLGQRLLVGNINGDGDIIVRNTSSTALTLTTDLMLVGTYVIN